MQKFGYKIMKRTSWTKHPWFTPPLPSQVNQENISRLEKRSDMKISTLQVYIEALGGKLNLTVDFPGRAPIRLQDIGMGHTP